MERFKTTKASAEFLERLTRATGVKRNFWSRAALGWSLALESLPDEEQDLDSEGMEHSRQMIFGDDEPILLGLIRQRYGRPIQEDRLGRIVKAHVERGLQMIQKEYERLNRRGDELMLLLLDQCSRTTVDLGPGGHPTPLVPPSPKRDSYEVRLPLGKAVRSGQEVSTILNGPGTAPHVAIMGRNGTGKTRTALKLISEGLARAGYSIPFLIFDYAKGDIASNREFLKQTDATVVKLPGEVISLAPLAIEQTTDDAVSLAAHRFRDTIGSVVRNLGPKQKSRCLDIIRDAYDHAVFGAPDLRDVANAAEQLYAAKGWAHDSLLACLREFTDFPLFRDAAQGIGHEFFQAPHIIDIHGLPEDLRKLTVFLMLDHLYSQVMSMPDAPLDQAGNRLLRFVIVIDEAHHYLPCKQPTLESMVREVRSKGVAIWLLSQSPDDFDQPKYNFAREVGLPIVFSCVLEKPKMLEALLGAKVDPRRLSQLVPGVALTRLPGSASADEVQTWDR